MSDKESQTDEVEALQSIFSEEEFSSTNENGVFNLQFYAFINLPKDFKVVYRNLNEPEDDVGNEQCIQVHYLPPIEMFIKLPHNYPSLAPPLFQICCSWLSNEMLAKLCKELDRLWTDNKGSEVLYIWTQFLKEECLNFLEVTDKLDLSVKYTRELVHINNNLKSTQRSSRSDASEQTKDIEHLSNSNNDKVANNCDIQKRLPLLDSVVINSNTIEKCDSDSVCSSEKSVSSDNSKNKNFHMNRREYGNRYYNEKKHNSNYKNSESEHVYHVNSGSGNRRRQQNEKRRPNYDKRKENENDDRIVKDDDIDGNYDYRKKDHFERKYSNVIAKSFNADKNQWEKVTTNENLYSRDTKKTSHDRSRKFRNNNFVTDCGSGGSSNVPPDVKTYNTFEFVNSKYRHNPHRRYVMNASKFESKKPTIENKQNKESKREVVEKKIDSHNINKYNRGENYNSESRMAPSPPPPPPSSSSSSSAVNNINSPLSATIKVPGSCSNKSSSPLSQQSINNSDTCANAELSSVHVLDIGSEALHRIEQIKVYDKRIRRPQQHKKHLHEVIEDYDRERSKTEFGRNIFICNICFANKLGIKCIQFKPCDHVFCRECISGYVEVRIKEGTVQSINCPEPKCESEASPPQIRELVSPELFAKYDHLLLSLILDTMGDIIYCPRPSCQYPVSKEENEKMAICPDCKYVFCIYCKMVYHGIEPCRIKNEEQLALIKEYQSANKETKLKMEQRYGKSLLTSLLENHMSETWIHDNSKPCPNCNTAIEKSDGCNKMVCWKCNTFFCWLCGAHLDALVPYKHYYDTNSRCNNRLFEGIVNEDGDNEEDLQFEEPEPVPFELGYNMFVINMNLDPELENHLLVRIDNVD